MLQRITQASVTGLATSRLIDAGATLDAGDRALLNLWVKRGLGDADVARMTGVSEETIADRRDRIVEHLSAVLGEAPEDVRSELDEVELVTPSANGAAAAAAERSAQASSWRGHPRRTALALLLTLLVAVVLVVVLTSGGSGRPRVGPSPPAVASTQTVPATSPASPSPAASTKPGAALVALSGGPAHAAGRVAITGSGAGREISVSVSDLPPASDGHYEVWLYDSLTYSEALGRLRNGVTHVSFGLPANATRFHWIDISFQPVGHVYHSGESLLRSANPLFGKAASSSS
jgi:hypothetical protein